MKLAICFVGLNILCIIGISQRNIGLIGGLNLSSQYNEVTGPSGNYKDNRKSIVDFHAGIVSDFKLSKKINFQPSLQFSGKGSKYTYMAGINMDIPVEQKYHLSYLELLLPVHYNIDINKNILFIGGGPSVAYGISGKSDNSFTSNTEDPFETFLKRFDAGVILQSGVRIKSFQASAAYNYGIYNFMRNESPWVQNGADVTWKNRAFSFSFAYFLKIKK